VKDEEEGERERGEHNPRHYDINHQTSAGYFRSAWDGGINLPPFRYINTSTKFSPEAAGTILLLSANFS